MNHFPIIKIEVENLRTSILHMLTERELELDSYLKNALDRLVTSEYIQNLVDYEAKQALDKAVEEEIKSFFAYGVGRKAVAAAVKEKLEKEMSDV